MWLKKKIHQYLFMIKILRKLGIVRNFLNLIKTNKQTNTKNPTAGIILNGEKVELFH